MRIVTLVLLLALSCTAAPQAVWKYVDEKGVTHYTDQPVPGAEKVQLRSGSTPTDTSAAPTTTTPGTTRSSRLAYRTFQIVSPANQDSVVNTGGLLQVSVRVEPAIMDGDALSLYLDGKVVDAPANALSYEIQNVSRGEHTLEGVIVDENGRRIAATGKITFTMRQTSILMKPPVGPSVRPPGKAPTTPRPPVRSRQPSFADLHPASPKPINTPAASL